MAFTLQKGIMPKSNKGRKAVEPNAELIEALLEGFRTGPLYEETEDFRVPVFLGPDWTFEKESRAQTDARRYQKVLRDKHGIQVAVNTYENGKKGNALRYLWRLYVPLAYSAEQNGSSDPVDSAEDGGEG